MFTLSVTQRSSEYNICKEDERREKKQGRHFNEEDKEEGLRQENRGGLFFLSS